MLLCKRVLGHRLKVNWCIARVDSFGGDLYFKIIKNKKDKLWINGISQKMVEYQGH